jgi:hypothetical protein
MTEWQRQFAASFERRRHYDPEHPPAQHWVAPAVQQSPQHFDFWSSVVQQAPWSSTGARYVPRPRRYMRTSEKRSMLFIETAPFD